MPCKNCMNMGCPFRWVRITINGVLRDPQFIVVRHEMAGRFLFGCKKYLPDEDLREGFNG